MDDPKDTSNIFLPLDKTSKFQESKSLFGGTSTLQSLSKHGESSGSVLPPKPVLSQSIFGNSSKGFDSSISSVPKFGQVTKEDDASSIFRNTASSVGTSSNIFGQVTPITSGTFQSKPLNSFQTSSVSSVASSSSELNFKSVSDHSYREKSDKFHSTEENQPSFSMKSEKFGTGSSAMFTLQSREAKDTDTDAADNIFGGKVEQSSTSSKSQQIDNKSSTNTSNESSYVFRNKIFPFGEYAKPEKVFASTKEVNSSPAKGFSFQSLIKNKGKEKQSANLFKKSESVKDATDFLNVQNKPSNTNITQESSLLIACDIPEKFLNKSVLETHFEKFGIVTKIIIRKKNETKQALIYFTEPKAAQEAKMKGKKLHPLVPEMKLFFGSQPQLKKKSEAVQKQKFTKPILVSRSVSPQISPFNKKIDTGFQKSSNIKSIESNTKPFSFSSKTEVKSKAPSGNIGSIKEFSVLMRTAAKNNYDKFLILDSRDKDLRAKQEKVLDLKKAHYLMATCPDMCPEKERYSRDIQYDISAYEMTNNEIDHKLTVKKFSRSSADKDEPLPHELRSGSVLKLTMDFLVCNIVEKGDENNVQIDLWYNYLCNRTRALRSDITQQHLLDINAVYVLERCIRFHIHCSHHLCEESPECFEAKINTEHLSKSLQSLKELYHDLEEKGYYFENEQEFRAYEILLSINDGNIIFKLLSFKESIRNSTEVQFAVKVLHSIHANNYSSFFRLLKEATYLQACIMHRYFANVRPKALYVIIKAYSSQRLPVDKVMTMLGFSVESEFANYVDHFGINISEDSKLIINKSNFTPTPESRPPVLKSDMITIKKTCSIGEIINNDPLPENPLLHYRPHSSFNSKGFLNEKAVDASDQISVSKEMETEHTTSIAIQEATEIRRMENNLQKSVDKMFKIKLIGRYFAIWKNFSHFQRKIQGLIEKSKNRNARKYLLLWKNKAHESVKLKRKADNLILSKYFRHWKMYVTWTKQNRVLQKIVKDREDAILLKKYAKIWKWKVNYLKTERKVNIAKDHILAFRYANKWLSITRESVRERKCDKYYSYSLLKASFLQWKAWCSVKKNKSKLNCESFPAISSLLSLEDQNRLLSWGYKREDKLNISAQEISQLNDDIISKSRKHCSIQKLSSMVAWTALPLVQSFQSDVFTKSPDFSRNSFYNCFKILLLIDPDTDPYLLAWIRTKFNILESEDVTKPLYCQHQFTSPHNEVTYSIFITEERLSYRNHSVDCSSLVFLIGNKNKNEKMKQFSETFQEVPFLILCKNERNESLSSNFWLMTRCTIDNPFTSEKLFNFVNNHWQLRKSRFKLQVNSCINVVCKFISDKVVSPVNKEVSQRLYYGKASLEPSKVVSFYNSAISHIISCLEKTKVQTSNWPPIEIISPIISRQKMVDGKDFEIVFSSLQDAYLPFFHVELNQSWDQTEEYLAKYIKNVISPSDWEGGLYSEVRNIIKESRKKFFEDKFYCNHRVKSDKFWYCIPWIEILNCFILFKLSRLTDRNIAYKASDLEEFDSAQYWISELRISEAEIPRAIGETPTVKRKAITLEPKIDVKKIKSDSILLQDIENEKQKALAYEKELEALIMAGEEELKLFYPELNY